MSRALRRWESDCDSDSAVFAASWLLGGGGEEADAGLDVSLLVAWACWGREPGTFPVSAAGGDGGELKVVDGDVLKVEGIGVGSDEGLAVVVVADELISLSMSVNSYSYSS